MSQPLQSSSCTGYPYHDPRAIETEFPRPADYGCGQRGFFTRTLPLAVFALASLLHSGASAQSAETTAYNRVNFSVEASASVPTDTVVANLFYQHEAPDPKRAAEPVNKAISWALSRAKDTPEVSARTLAYSTRPIHNKQRIEGWRVRQTIELRSPDVDAMTGLMGELQSKLALASIRQEVSKAALAGHREQLVAKALATYESRASAIASHLSRDGFRLVRLDIDTRRLAPPHPVTRSVAMAAASDSRRAPPVIEGGTQELTVSVSALIELGSGGN